MRPNCPCGSVSVNANVISMRTKLALAALGSFAFVSGCDSKTVARPSAEGSSPSVVATSSVPMLTNGSACPQGTDAIESRDADHAYAATLAFEKATSTEVQQRSVLAADRAGDHGAEVAQVCGAAVAHRTIVVEAQGTDVGLSESLAQIVTYVSHRGDTWFVWSQPH